MLNFHLLILSPFPLLHFFHSYLSTLAPRDQQPSDPETLFKLKECCDLLIAGGYFRARIPTLSPFDKVVGGIVWAMTASNVGVDIDLLFEENSTIGQRIKLAENIVTSLIRMQCPHPLQSFQIQGLDYDHILPTLRWLVRRVIETRTLTGDEVRAQSVAAFARFYTLPQDMRTESSLSYVSNSTTKYRSQRRFKKREGALFDSDIGRVEATLLEYDERLLGVGVVDEEQEETHRQRVAEGKVKTTEGEEDATVRAQRQLVEDRERIALLQGQLSTNETVTQHKVSGSLVGKILSMRVDAIAQAEQTFENDVTKNAANQLSAKDIKRAEEQRHQRKVDNLQRRIQEAEAVAESKLGTLQETNEKVEEARKNIAVLEEALAEILAETEKLVEIENSSENQEILAKLKSLVGVVEKLKKMETSFKQMCRSEHKRLSELIAAEEELLLSEDDGKLAELDKLIEADKDKLAKLKQLIALRNQEIARVARAIGEIPTRAELLQFERRFVELYELVAERLVESRKYYEMYNRLNTIYQYLQSELTILESIITNFPIGMKTQASQTQMLSQFEKMLVGVQNSRETVELQYESARQKEVLLVTKYDKLLERQRTYFKLVKDFQDECDVNEKLSAALEELQVDGE